MENEGNKKDEKPTSKTLIILIAVCVGIAITIPVVVNLLLYLPIPTASGLGNPEWLAFWGNYSGGCLGGICTLITIYITVKYYEKQDKAHQEELEQQNKKHEQELKEEVLRRYRPVLVLQPNGGSGSNGKYNPFILHVHNVSEVAVVNLQIANHYIAFMKPGEEQTIQIKSDKNGGGYNDTLKIIANDILGNKYEWHCELEELPDLITSSGKMNNRHYYRIKEEIRS